MDAFYAAVETLSDPLLEGKPMAVGGLSMISTANYEVCFGLCTIYACRSRFSAFTCVNVFHLVFRNYDPHFIAGSLDEAYLDIIEVCRERGLSGGEIAEELRLSVYYESGLTCSAGVAANHLLAKVCSDINKPNGQFVLQNDRSTVMKMTDQLS